MNGARISLNSTLVYLLPISLLDYMYIKISSRITSTRMLGVVEEKLINMTTETILVPGSTYD